MMVAARGCCKRKPFPILWIASMLVILLLSQLDASSACPHQCQCNNGAVRCQGAGLRMVPNGIPQHISVLDFQDNHLSENSFGRGGLRGAMPQALILENNHFRMLHTNVFSSINGRGLMVLNLQNNFIQRIEGGVFRNFVNLRKLMIGNNRLQQISPMAFTGLRTLTSLQLDQNFLTQIPRALFSQTPHLIELGVSRNRLQALSGCQFSNLSFLRDLELDNNALTSIDENAFAGLSNLRHIDLDRNRISTLQSCAFADLVNLITLDIDHNLIQQVHPNAFVGLQSLQQINMFRNRLSILPDGLFAELPNLFHVDLSHNGIGRLNPTMFNDVTNLTLRLENNPLQCDCSLLWLHWMAGGQNSNWNNNNNNWRNSNNNNNNNHQIEGGTCVSPPQHYGNSIDNVQIQCHAPAMIIPAQQAVRPGGTAHFVCMRAMRGYEVQWMHNGQPVSNRHNVIINEGMLTIRHITPRDAGTYSCSAGSGIGHFAMQAPIPSAGGMMGQSFGGGHGNNIQPLQVQQGRLSGPAGPRGGSAGRLTIRNARPASHMCTAAATTLQRPGHQRKATLIARCQAYSQPQNSPNIFRNGGAGAGNVPFDGVAAPNLPKWSACPNCRGSSSRSKFDWRLLVFSLITVVWLIPPHQYLAQVA